MTLTEIIKRVGKSASNNSPALLTALGVSGTVTTAYLAHQAGMKTARRLGEEPPFITRREKFDKTWRFYIPPVLSGVTTVGSIILATRISTKRAAAAYSVLAVSQQAFGEYKDKVVEVLGEKKEQGIHDKIAQERVLKSPPSSTTVSAGKVLCYELYTGRYFECDKQTLDRAVNEINFQVTHHMYATLDDFYDKIGLKSTQYSDSQGWDSDRLVDLIYSTALIEEGVPVLVFSYSYVKPIH